MEKNKNKAVKCTLMYKTMRLYVRPAWRENIKGDFCKAIEVLFVSSPSLHGERGISSINGPIMVPFLFSPPSTTTPHSRLHNLFTGKLLIHHFLGCSSRERPRIKAPYLHANTHTHLKCAAPSVLRQHFLGFRARR